MMGQTFSSEDEHFCSLLDDNKDSTYPLIKDDPIIFYNADYERELLMAFDLDFGESDSTAQFHIKEETATPTWPSPSEPEMPPTPKPRKAAVHRYNPYSSGPLIKEMPKSVRVDTVHSNWESPAPSKRGRPGKTTGSDSKMANYARNYREMKKNELAISLMRNQELEEELRLLREENAMMKTSLTIASEEIVQLRKVIDQDSQIASVVARMNNGNSSQYSLGAGSSKANTGVCVHVGSQGTTVEVCKQCAENSSQRLEKKNQNTDYFNPSTELFNGDFSVFDDYLN